MRALIVWVCGTLFASLIFGCASGPRPYGAKLVGKSAMNIYVCKYQPDVDESMLCVDYESFEKALLNHGLPPYNQTQY